MGRIIWFINGFCGGIVGFFIIILAIYSLINNFNINYIGWLLVGIISFVFGIYQWRKFFISSKKIN